MSNFTDLLNVDREVVDGINEKLSLREIELSKFVPLLKLYAIIEDINLTQEEKSSLNSIDIFIKNKIGTDTIKRKAIEIGRFVSQTEREANFRGGIGITDFNVKYAIIEAGTFEAKLGIMISNLEQIQLNPAASRLFFPGNDFLIVYGWNTNNDFFSLKDGDTVDLHNYSNGLRKSLYCTLHHFDWEFGDQGRINGILYFIAPDTMSMLLSRIDYSSSIINYHLQNVNELLNIMRDELGDRIQDYINQTLGVRRRNSKVIEKINEIHRTARSILAAERNVGQNKPFIIQNISGISTIMPAGDSRNIDENVQEYVYFGWIIESAKYIVNSSVTSYDKKIIILYEDLDKQSNNDLRSKLIKYRFINQDKKLEEISLNIIFDNVFFIPIQLDKAKYFINNFKGNIKDFMYAMCEEVGKEYGLSLTVDNLGNGFYIIDDTYSKFISKDKKLKSGGGERFYQADENTPHFRYGFSNSLVSNLKISSTVPPDIIWTLGIEIGSKISIEELRKIFKLTNEDLDLPENSTYKKILNSYLSRIDINQAKVIANNRRQNIYMDFGIDEKIAKEVVNNALEEDQRLKAEILSPLFKSGNINLGTIIRNYFNGITLNIHGTTGLKAYNCFLFSGYELSTKQKGIDGLYSIIMLNDSVTPQRFETLLEARMINSLNVQ